METIFILLLLITTLSADQNPLFPTFVESGSTMQAAFNGGGAALPDKISGSTLNPASLYGYHKLYGKRIGIAGSYQNSLEGRTLSNAGVSLALDQQNVIGLDYTYRNNRESLDQIIQKGTIVYSSLVREEEKDGMLSWGLSVTYYNATGAYSAPILSTTSGDSTRIYQSPIDSLTGWNQSVTSDIGVYQVDKVRGLSYGIVLENIVGYTWKNRDNSIATHHSNDTIDTMIIATDSMYFTGKTINENGWNNGSSKSLLMGFGINRKIFGDNVLLAIPFDVRFWGFMDKNLRNNSKWKNRCMLYTGAELNFGGALSLRSGYSWAPRVYVTDEKGSPLFRNHHQASGGFRLSFKVADLEMAFKKEEIGGGISFYF